MWVREQLGVCKGAKGGERGRRDAKKEDGIENCSERKFVRGEIARVELEEWEE